MSAESSITNPGRDAPSVADEQHKKDRLELIIAILLGVVSIGIAYASFQAALHDSEMAAAYQRGTALSAEAESLYLEGNQTYVQDAELWNQLLQLSIEAESTDPVTAANAQTTSDVLAFQAVSEELGAAIAWADEQNAADPETYYSPLDSEDYRAALFGGYEDTNAQAEAAVAEGDEANSLGDRLMLYTVLMSISLFLLGIAAVVRQYRVQLILVFSGSAIFIVAAILTAFVPFVPL
jgi:Tfp pilus assembly protein PilE